MKVRCVSFALVSAAYLAAFATTCGTALASPDEANSALVRKAYATLQSGDAQAAVAEYSDAIASEMLEPEMLANALLNRALAQQQLQDNAAAVADYDAAFSLNIMAPALRSTALYNRGLANQKLANTARAVEDFTASLLINPKFAEAYYCRANALRDSGQLLFALSDYERAIRYNHPDKARVHYGFATAYLALKRPLDAKREFSAALDINPDYGQARAQLVLLGDQSAQIERASDPILTGSVGAYTGGTVASKPGFPAAVVLPTVLQASIDKKLARPHSGKSKKIEDRVPEQRPPEVISEQDATSGQDEVATLDVTPAIPEPAIEEATQAVAEVPVEDTATDTAPALSGWVIQIASADTEKSAWTTWKKMQSRYSVLKSKSPNVVRADLGAKGVFYRVRLGGFDAQASAKQACAKLKAGGVSCYISKVGS